MSHIANDWTPPPPRELTAMEAAYRAIDWTTSKLAERARTPVRKREAKAKMYEHRAASFAAQAKDHPSLLEMAGLHALAARIMRAGE